METFNKYNLFDARMVVCVGAGGVGKTTLGASIAQAAARAGKRVACITIDPARRLADSFQLDKEALGAGMIDISHQVDGIAERQGCLHVGMLDARNAFETIVLSKSTSEEMRQRILQNKLYKYVSGSLNGIHEYMACYKLSELNAQGTYDFIVLDTPPSANAIDFFTAPQRIRMALDGPFLRIMRSVYQSSGGFGDFVRRRWAIAAFGAMGKITGEALMTEIMEFLEALSGLFGNFQEMVDSLEALLRSDDLSVLMITLPDALSMEQAAHFKQRLADENIGVNAVLFNKCHLPRVPLEPSTIISAEQVAQLRALNVTWNRNVQDEQQRINVFLKDMPALHGLQVPLLPETVDSVMALSHIWKTMQANVDMAVSF